MKRSGQQLGSLPVMGNGALRQARVGGGSEVSDTILDQHRDPSHVSPRGRVRQAVRVARKHLRFRLTQALFSHEYLQLRALKDTYRGRRGFIVANGPSLKSMNLCFLKNEFVCILNNGGQAIGGMLPHADMHVVFDNNKYRRFAAEFESVALTNSIPYRFFNFKLRKDWKKLDQRSNRPYFIIGNPRPLLEGGFVRDPWRGYGDCATVVLPAVQIMYYMGFSEIYVLGVDLDYESQGPYFYSLGAKDRVHEQDPKVQGRRAASIPHADEEFALVLRVMQADGRKLVNAGVGGRLDALPRVNFAALFA
jgi:hypothetical protein